MDQQQAQMMQNYPDPTAVATETNGPFYAANPAGQQQQQQQPQQLQQQPSQEPQQQHQQQLQHQQQDPEQDQRHANPELQIAQHAIQFSAQPNLDLKSMLDIHAGDPRLADEPHQQQQQQQQQMSADMGHGQSQNQYGGPADGTTPRKRSKVSRACDECRRKKIRCDATTESGQEQCTSCKRVGTHCQFSRIPMKRGPSKGYIKELADRLNRLEGDMHNNQASEQIHYPPPPNAEMGISRRASQDFSPPPQMDGQQSTGRKRTHSSISQEFGTPGFGPHVPQRQSGQWSQFETPRHAAPQPFAQGPADPYRPIPSYSPNGLAPQAQFPNARDVRAFIDNNHMEQLDAPKIELDENVYDRYFETIHSTFPILPWKEALFQRLKNCAPAVASALHAAMYAVTSTLTGNHNPDETRRANNFITQCMQDDFAQARMFNGGRIILLAAVTLMAIEAGHRSNSVGSQSAYLGQGIALAQDLRLHAYQEGTHPEDDSDEQLGRRLWWTLVLIDRFHASGKAVPLMIPESSVVLYKEDAQNLGPQTYELARISLSLAHLANFISIPAPVNSNPTLVQISRNYASVINSHLEEIRITLPPDHHSSTTPLTYLAFWHTRILLRRLQDNADPAETFDDAHNILNLVPSVFSPLCKDFTVLAVVSLMELLDHENSKIKSDAEQELKMYISSASRFTTSDSWEVQLRDLILKRVANIGSPSQTQAGSAQAQQASTSSAALTASQGLQHLADLATAGDTARQEQEAAGNGNGNGNGAAAWDKEKLTRGGFLTVLGNARATAAAPRTFM